MESSIRKSGSITIVELRGQMKGSDSKMITALFDELFREKVKTISIDCRRIDFIDSTCIGAFMAARNKAQDINMAISIFSLSEDMKDIFEITGLNTTFDMFSSEAEMLEKIANQ